MRVSASQQRVELFTVEYKPCRTFLSLDVLTKCERGYVRGRL
jgi:hypothetical protein